MSAVPRRPTRATGSDVVKGCWDDGAHAGVAAACACTIAASALALAIAAWPSHRRLLGPWWLAPPLVLGAAAAALAATTG